MKMPTNHPLADAGDYIRCACGCSRFWRRAGAEPIDHGDGIAVEGRCIACFPLPRWLPTGHTVEIFQYPLSEPARSSVWSEAMPIVIETIEA
jgi:hypothetical protein